MKQLVYSPKSLGQIIRRSRKFKHLNQTDAGTLMNLEQRTVSSIEQGTPGTRIDTIFRLLAALDLEMTISSKNRTIVEKDEGW